MQKFLFLAFFSALSLCFLPSSYGVDSLAPAFSVESKEPSQNKGLSPDPHAPVAAGPSSEEEAAQEFPTALEAIAAFEKIFSGQVEIYDQNLTCGKNPGSGCRGTLFYSVASPEGRLYHACRIRMDNGWKVLKVRNAGKKLAFQAEGYHGLKTGPLSILPHSYRDVRIGKMEFRPSSSDYKIKYSVTVCSPSSEKSCHIEFVEGVGKRKREISKEGTAFWNYEVRWSEVEEGLVKARQVLLEELREKIKNFSGRLEVLKNELRRAKEQADEQKQTFNAHWKFLSRGLEEHLEILKQMDAAEAPGQEFRKKVFEFIRNEEAYLNADPEDRNGWFYQKKAYSRSLKNFLIGNLRQETESLEIYLKALTGYRALVEYADSFDKLKKLEEALPVYQPERQEAEPVLLDPADKLQKDTERAQDLEKEIFQNQKPFFLKKADEEIKKTEEEWQQMQGSFGGFSGKKDFFGQDLPSLRASLEETVRVLRDLKDRPEDPLSTDLIYELNTFLEKTQIYLDREFDQEMHAYQAWLDRSQMDSNTELNNTFQYLNNLRTYRAAVAEAADWKRLASMSFPARIGASVPAGGPADNPAQKMKRLKEEGDNLRQRAEAAALQKELLVKVEAEMTRARQQMKEEEEIVASLPEEIRNVKIDVGIGRIQLAEMIKSLSKQRRRDAGKFISQTRIYLQKDLEAELKRYIERLEQRKILLASRLNAIGDYLSRLDKYRDDLIVAEEAGVVQALEAEFPRPDSIVSSGRGRAVNPRQGLERKIKEGKSLMGRS